MLNRRELLGTAAAGVAMLGGTQFATADDKQTADTTPHYRVKQILGATVNIDDGASVGKVDDIVLDQNGKVDYLIIVNEDRKLVTIPWDAAQFNAEKRVAVVHITQEKYREIPVYSAEKYPVFSTPAYRTQTYQYFGLTPGQERRLIRRARRAND